jgi:hypothetical protein
MKAKEEFGGLLAVKEGVANMTLVKVELKVYDEKWNGEPIGQGHLFSGVP